MDNKNWFKSICRSLGLKDGCAWTIIIRKGKPTPVQVMLDEIKVYPSGQVSLSSYDGRTDLYFTKEEAQKHCDRSRFALLGGTLIRWEENG